MSLHDDAREFLEAGGYAVTRAASGFLDLAKPEPGRNEAARILLWSDDSELVASRDLTPAERAGREQRETALLAAFQAETTAAPEATAFFLSSRRLGLSQGFISGATRLLNGGIRVPVEFFDTAYKTELSAGRSARSVMGDLLSRTEKLRRVAQPFFIRHGLGANDRTPGNGDLVEFLETTLMEPGQGPRLRFIDGSAGIGKTVAFNALVKGLFDEFKAAKAERQQRRRPIVFLPEHIRDQPIGYLDDVIDAASQSDMASPLEPEQVRWLLDRGFAMWMFDGLDEFYAGSNDFFAYLDKVLANPASEAQILISTRDSLFTSSDALAGFIRRHLRPGGLVEIYELAPWDATRWRGMAWLELENGRAGAEHSQRVTEFVTSLEASSALSELARLPFYCAVLLERFKAHASAPKDELELLDFLLDRMIEREHGKDVFRWQDFVDVETLSAAIDDDVGLRVALPDNADTRGLFQEVLDGQGRENLIELIEGLAHAARRNPGDGAAGLGVADLRDLYGATYSAADLAPEDMRRLSTVLVQFALFGPGRAAGSVDFTHQILADYLAGRYAVRLVSREADRQHALAAAGQHPTVADIQRPETVVRLAIGMAPFQPGSIFHRTIARAVAADPQLERFLQATRARGSLGRPNVDAALAALTAPA